MNNLHFVVICGSSHLELLIDFSYHMARLRSQQGAGARPLAADMRAILTMESLKDPIQFGLWEDFFRTQVHLLSRQERADKILLQLAAEHADDSPITIEAESWLNADNCDWFWLRRTRRSHRISLSDCIRVFDCGASVKGMTCYGQKILSWSGKKAQVWDLRNGEELCTFDATFF